jgi:hypothetical protein
MRLIHKLDDAAGAHRRLKKFVVLLVPVALATLAGCNAGGEGTVVKPASNGEIPGVGQYQQDQNPPPANNLPNVGDPGLNSDSGVGQYQPNQNPPAGGVGQGSVNYQYYPNDDPDPVEPPAAPDVADPEHEGPGIGPGGGDSVENAGSDDNAGSDSDGG